MNTEDQVLKDIVSYWNQLVIVNSKLCEKLSEEELSALKNQKQNLEITLLSLFDKLKSRLEIIKQIQPTSVAIDITKGTEVFRTFVGKTTARITTNEQETLVKNYTKLLQLVNESAARYCSNIKEGFVKDSSALTKQIEEQQVKLKDSAKCIEGLEDEIRKTRNEALKQIGQSGEDSVEKSRQVYRAKDDYNKLKESHRALLEVEKALRKENTELIQENKKRLSLT